MPLSSTLIVPPEIASEKVNEGNGNNQKCSVPVNVSGQGSLKGLVVEILNRFISLGKGGLVIEDHVKPGKGLKNQEYQRSAAEIMAEVYLFRLYSSP